MRMEMMFEILRLADERGWITPKTAWQKVGDKYDRIRKRMRQLEDLGLLQRTRRGLYTLTDRGKEVLEVLAWMKTKEGQEWMKFVDERVRNPTARLVCMMMAYVFGDAFPCDVEYAVELVGLMTKGGEERWMSRR